MEDAIWPRKDLVGRSRHLPDASLFPSHVTFATTIINLGYVKASLYDYFPAPKPNRKLLRTLPNKTPRRIPSDSYRPRLPMPDDGQTSDEDYEYHEYETFPPVKHDRLLSWKAGNGRVHFGIKGAATATSLKTDTDREDVLVPGGSTLLVIKTRVKLVDKS